MELYIGNKNYSSWSMRPWLILEHFQIPFQEYVVFFDDFQPDHLFKQTMIKISPTGKVPVLVDGELVIWDSLAICEYLADRFPDRGLWPEDPVQRAQARSACAEMHSSFSQLRSLCGMNIEADLSKVGQQLWAEHAALRQDVARIEQIWAMREEKAFLFDHHFTIADAFYAPVVMRLRTYQLPISAQTQQYCETICNVPAVQHWVNAACQEHQFVLRQEPYRQQPDEA